MDAIPEIETIFPSDANFLLIRIQKAKQIYYRSAELGVVIRYRGDQMHCEETLRITIGTRAENEELLKVLKQIIILVFVSDFYNISYAISNFIIQE